MVLFTGKTVEEAIETGLQELGLSRLKAHIKVISKEKKGFLGFGKKPAQVDIEGISDKTVYKADKKATQKLEAEDTKVVPLMSEDSPAQTLSNLAEIVTETKAQQPSIPVEESEVPQDPGNDGFSKDIEKAAQEVSDYVTKIIYEMDIEATVETSNNRRQINLQIETPEAGRVIGYHGKVLKSLQLLAQNFLHDRYSKNFSVSLNVHDYVEHRTETLIDFTQKVAKRVLESGQDYTMDPMSNSERKIVHKTVSSIEGVDSYSEGNDPNRYVVVSLQR
ncbi:TPA: protein jag [Streptococcus pyogenes]|nr:protein jag [Streptococcus pyogenes]HEQ4516543.1 protein jag [Streptococcus pyogenes]HEQ4523091.1 protein jag [Streptococcus pyogenes]HEQ4529580.1 protein jag [Streptococcus pyogenes]HEQ4819767.1 protein jag [Streptococcus pyogenes]